MAEKNKAIPAFPHQKEDGSPYWGMDIRDWFAGMSLQELIKINENASVGIKTATDESIIKAIAKQAYDVADALIEERGK